MLLNPECCSFSWLHTCTHCHRSLLQKKKCYPIVRFTTGNEVKMLSGPGWHLWVKMHIQMQADFHSRDVRHNDTYEQTPKHRFWTSLVCLPFFFFSFLFHWIQHISWLLLGENNFTLGDFSNMKREKKGLDFYHPLQKKSWNFTCMTCTVKTSCTRESDTLWPSFWDLCHLAAKSVSCCLVLSTEWIYLIASCLCNRQATGDNLDESLGHYWIVFFNNRGSDNRDKKLSWRKLVFFSFFKNSK